MADARCMGSAPSARRTPHLALYANFFARMYGLRLCYRGVVPCRRTIHFSQRCGGVVTESRLISTRPDDANRHFNSTYNGSNLIDAGGLTLAICKRNRVLGTTILPRRTAHDFLEDIREGACGFVAEGLRNLGNGIIGARYSVPS